VLKVSYGAEHQRYKMCSGGCGGLDPSTLYLYDPATGGMSERYAPVLHPVTWRDYIVADGKIVAVRSLTGSTLSWSYAVGDHLNSTTSIADTASPPNVERDSYDAWGKRRHPDATDDSGCSITSQLPRGYGVSSNTTPSFLLPPRCVTPNSELPAAITPTGEAPSLQPASWQKV